MIAFINYIVTRKKLKFHPWWLYLMCNTFMYPYVILICMYLFSCIHLYMYIIMFCLLILYMYLQYYIAIEPFAPSPPINKCTIQLTKYYDMCQLCL